MKSKPILLLILFCIAFGWGIYTISYHYSYHRDLKQKPWAYSRNADADLLIGKWQGSFIDPNDIAKSINLEIFVPTTDEERKEKALRFLNSNSRRLPESKSAKRSFDGVAEVVSTLGTEKYTFYGHVGEDDFHELEIQFGHEDENKKLRPNFNLNLVEKGHWQGDELTMELNFTYNIEDGSSHWDSANPKHQKTALVKFHRK